MSTTQMIMTAISCRNVDTSELIKRLNDDQARAPRAPRAKAPMEKMRLLQRIFCGFQNPFREAAISAVVLRRLGYQVDLVIGYEPLPHVGGRRLFTWQELAGRPVGTSMPAHIFYSELLRFPS